MKDVPATDDLRRRRRATVDAAVRRLAEGQAGVLARRQLTALGFDHLRVRNQIAAGRWAARSDLVVSTTTGVLTREQTMWLGTLHAGPESLVGGLTAAEVHGLCNWYRDDVTVLVDDDLFPEPVHGVRFVRTRRSLTDMRSMRPGLPISRLEPGLLLWAGYAESARAAQGVLAAAVQQRLTTPDELMMWIGRMRPLRRARLFRSVLLDIAGGSQSLAEIDVVRMCRRLRIRPPDQQRKRRDSSGRIRWTDCEWRLPSGHIVVLEIDGAFHMEVDQWEDDLARQRRISGPGRTVVRCTAREARDEPDQLGRDLIALGVPVVGPSDRYSAR